MEKFKKLEANLYEAIAKQERLLELLVNMSPRRAKRILELSREAPSEAPGEEARRWKGLATQEQDFTQSHRQPGDTVTDSPQSLDNTGGSIAIDGAGTSDTLNALRPEMIRVGNLPKTLDLNSPLVSVESASTRLPSTSATGSMPRANVGHHGTSRAGASGGEARLRAETRAGKRLDASGELEDLAEGSKVIGIIEL